MLYTKEDFIEDMEFIEELTEKIDKCYEYLGENEITETFDEVHDKLVNNVIGMFALDGLHVEEDLCSWIYNDFYEEDTILESIKDYSVLYGYLIK
jgi:hypothetical protein